MQTRGLKIFLIPDWLKGARRIEANLCSCFHEATEGRNFRRVLSVASFPFLSFVPPNLPTCAAASSCHHLFRGLLRVWLGAAEDISQAAQTWPVRDTALPHLPPHLDTSPASSWQRVPPPAAPTAGNLFSRGLIRRSLNSRSLFSFYRVSKPSFLLASNLPNIPTPCLYITPPLLASLFPKWISQSHSFICSYFLLLWDKSIPLFGIKWLHGPLFILRAEAARSFSWSLPSAHDLLGEAGWGGYWHPLMDHPSSWLPGFISPG